MCTYKTKNELKKPKAIFIKLIKDVQQKVKGVNQIKFDWKPIGSGKKNLVVKNCKTNFFDLDYQLILTNISKLNIEPKKIKSIFISAFNECKTKNFKNCEDSTQAITIKNKLENFGADIIITKKENNSYYILYNKKNTNFANNNDYEWEKRPEFISKEETLRIIKEKKLYEILKNKYLEKRHDKTSDKKSYQILNETINEVIYENNKLNTNNKI